MGMYGAFPRFSFATADLVKLAANQRLAAVTLYGCADKRRLLYYWLANSSMGSSQALMSQILDGPDVP
jgi:hypothetical protein